MLSASWSDREKHRLWSFRWKGKRYGELAFRRKLGFWIHFSVNRCVQPWLRHTKITTVSSRTTSQNSEKKLNHTQKNEQGELLNLFNSFIVRFIWLIYLITQNTKKNCFEQGLEGGVLIPHSRSIFTRIPLPVLFSLLSRILLLLFFFIKKYIKTLILVEVGSFGGISYYISFQATQKK